MAEKPKDIICPETKHEFEIISTMLTRAKEYHLEVEVIWSFYNAITGSQERGIAEAAFIALGEWDI